ncbi:neutral alpha-glucosidase AB-like isoform X2 [Episyrphus balteatus]|uniref:neutral alpha-glucosidase AB-like isoform X2 n=1 Tax=Episyrphus balteatus TaxID=286459 RepID=UPI002485CF8B|nr:neutral alpha-glucosidase AB-like isoform X2 [Episyrphus balteatus]
MTWVLDKLKLHKKKLQDSDDKSYQLFKSKMRLAIFVLIFCTFHYGSGVDPKNFKTCDESSFCRRCRKVQPGNSKFVLLPGTLNTYSDSITIDLINKDTNHLFILKVEALEGDIFHVLIDEKTPLQPRYRVTDALKGTPKSGTIKVEEVNDNQLSITTGINKAIIHANPFKIDFYQNDVLSVSVNAKGLMNFEHLRHKTQPAIAGENEVDGEVPEVPKTIEDEDPGAWEENFKSHHDSKPRGPEAIALDFSFPEADVLFGIPEHADSFILKSTQGTDPYRLYNLDVFEYVLDSKMALYGSVPVIYGHGPQRTAGVYWQNAAETWVDVLTTEKNVVSSIVNFVSGSRKSDPPTAHFMSESGIVDAFILLGPTPLDAFKQYTDLTGTANLPQLFTLAYHQCRWNYNDDKDVETVSAKFDEYDIPMDTMWLDIEYTDGKKYFTWDAFKFPNPLAMIKNLTDLGRHLTIIIDPHMKRDSGYFFHNYCTDNGLYTKTSDGKDYEGWCWPGSVSYPDFFNPVAREYYSDQYLLSNFKTTTADVMFWNDMNEPSVFNGPEVTMVKDTIHHGNWEHRNVHNLYGHMQLMATFDGMIKRDPNQRPFILTRAHFAGSQRYAIIWTGDNLADWGHLQHSIKMCLSEAVAGFSFCGADVGGFFGNPEIDLLERWYQTGAFLPFFRAHAHIDTKRREPWLFSEKTRLIIRDALRKRYSYLPFWYTMFYEHEKYGFPVMRPLLAHYPADKDAYAIDSEFLLHDSLLVRPVMEKGVSKVDVYFPAKDEHKNGDVWFDIDNFQKHEKVGYETIAVDERKTPVFQRGGSIIPKKERIRRAATLMKDDPYTLVVCLDKDGTAKGSLYIDDEKSYDYRAGKFIYTKFEFKDQTLKNSFETKPNYDTKSWLERVVIAGLDKTPKSATLYMDGKPFELDILPHEKAIAIRKPGVNMAKKFVIKLNY